MRPSSGLRKVAAGADQGARMRLRASVFSSCEAPFRQAKIEFRVVEKCAVENGPEDPPAVVPPPRARCVFREDTRRPTRLWLRNLSMSVKSHRKKPTIYRFGVRQSSADHSLLDRGPRCYCTRSGSPPSGSLLWELNLQVASSVPPDSSTFSSTGAWWRASFYFVHNKNGFWPALPM